MNQATDQTGPQNPENGTPAATDAAVPTKKPLSTFQRILEHGLSFAILVPAIGSFLVLLLAIMILVPQEGPLAGLMKAFAFSGNFITAGYVVGLLPSAITGVLVYPFWRALGGGWKAYGSIAAFNGCLGSLAGLFLVRLDSLEFVVLGFVGALATLASLFMTRKLRQA